MALKKKSRLLIFSSTVKAFIHQPGMYDIELKKGHTFRFYNRVLIDFSETKANSFSQVRHLVRWRAPTDGHLGKGGHRDPGWQSHIRSLDRFWHFDVDVAAKRADHSWADGQEDCLLREEYGQYKLGGWVDWLYSQSRIEIIPQQNMNTADKSNDDQVLTVKKADRAADTGTYRIKLTCEGGR